MTHCHFTNFPPEAGLVINLHCLDLSKKLIRNSPKSQHFCGGFQVSTNGCTPKSSILVGFSWMFHCKHHPAIGVPPFQEIPNWIAKSLLNPAEPAEDAGQSDASFMGQTWPDMARHGKTWGGKTKRYPTSWDSMGFPVLGFFQSPIYWVDLGSRIPWNHEPTAQLQISPA